MPLDYLLSFLIDLKHLGDDELDHMLRADLTGQNTHKFLHLVQGGLFYLTDLVFIVGKSLLQSSNHLLADLELRY